LAILFDGGVNVGHFVRYRIGVSYLPMLHLP
jgi:hypothetical protein